ncbi:MAG: hypothetical protein Q8M02_01205 [Candidatus Didemnitutus sp.]|nr:hypothetical protein [Candidatus Didemnitutus sp.]
MNQTLPVPPVRRRNWPWIVGLLLTPFLVLGIAAASYLTLESDAAMLRTQVMAATGTTWKTKVQFNIGRATLGAVGAGLSLVDHQDIADARLALAAVRHASVGVYELTGAAPQISRSKLLTVTDNAMRQRGWTRMVSVAEERESVLIYVSENSSANAPLELCLAVVGERELVVVSTRVSPDEIGALVERHAGKALRQNLREHAKL